MRPRDWMRGFYNPAAPPSARGSCAPSSVPFGCRTTAPACPMVSGIGSAMHLDVVAGRQQAVDQVAVEARLPAAHCRAPSPRCGRRTSAGGRSPRRAAGGTAHGG